MMFSGMIDNKYSYNSLNDLNKNELTILLAYFSFEQVLVHFNIEFGLNLLSASLS